MTPGLTFDEPAHQYFWQGRPVPNTTRIIAHLTDYSHIPPDRLVRLQEEGKAVHKLVELDCRNDLNTDTLPDWLKPHYAAWCRFKEDTGFECWDAERRVYHEKLGYAGTLDLAGILPKLPKTRDAAIIDVKRSLYGGPAIGLQTVSYEDGRNALVPKDQRTRLRFALVLGADGAYRLTQYSDPDDRGAFLACLQQWYWRAKHYPNTTTTETRHVRSA